MPRARRELDLTTKGVSDAVADCMRIHRAGVRSKDPETIGAAEARILILCSKIGLPPNDPLVKIVCEQNTR